MNPTNSLSVNSPKSLPQNTTKWYTIDDLSAWTGISVETLKKGDSPLKKLSIDFEVETQKGGYHNSQVFYSENVLKALKEYQIKNGGSNASKNKEVINSGNISFIQNQTIQAILDDPNALMQLVAMSSQKAIEMQRRAEIAESKNEIMQPKAEFYDKVTGSKDCCDMKEVAKVLNFKNVGRNKLFEILRNAKVLDNTNIPYQKYIDAEYFRVIESKFTDKDGDVHINLKTVVYQKGIDYIRKVVLKSPLYLNEVAENLIEKTYTYDQAAELTGLSVDTIKNIYYKRYLVDDMYKPTAEAIIVKLFTPSGRLTVKAISELKVFAQEMGGIEW